MSIGPVLPGRVEARGADPVRVLQFVSLFGMGGTERQVVNLARGLDRSRFEPHSACLERWGQFLPDLEAARIPLTEYRIHRLYGGKTLRQQFRFARDLRRNRIEVVHTYGFWTNVFGIPAARLAGTPVVVGAIRDTCDHITPAQRRVQRLACGLADAILVNADAIKQRLISDGYDAERITVITNGIDLAPFHRPPEPGRLRRELDLPTGAPVVAVFARLHPVKGIEHFLEAAVAVSARFPQARFLVVGERRLVRDGVIVVSPYSRELQAYSARLGLADRVVFTGFRDDVPEVLAEVSVSVLPCVSNEGLSNSVLESMAAGVPVVATTVGGNPEAVQDGVSGLLVPPRDAGALARAICTVLQDRELAGRLGHAGRQRVVEHFSIEQMVRRTEQFYLGLLAKKKQRRPAAELWEGTA